MAQLASDNRRIPDWGVARSQRAAFKRVCSCGSWLAAFVAGIVVAAGEPGVQPPRPELPAAYYAALGRVNHQFKQDEEAIVLYRKALQLLGPNDEQQRLEYRLALAEAFLGAGHKEDAYREWDALAQGPDAATRTAALLRLAERMEAEGKADEAAKRYEDIFAKCPIAVPRSSAARHLAKLLKTADNKAAKVEEYKKRLAKDPKDQQLLELVLELQDPQGRVETLKMVSEANPQDLALQYHYGSALLGCDRVDDAEKLYSNLVKNHPEERLRANEQLARIAMVHNKPAEAEAKQLEAVTQLAPGFHKSLYLARQFLVLGLPAAAEKWARQANGEAEGEEQKSEVAIEWGEALVRLERYADARPLLQPLAQQNTLRRLQQRAQQLLAVMEKQTAPSETKAARSEGKEH